jgi:hypothetical protein
MAFDVFFHDGFCDVFRALVILVKISLRQAAPQAPGSMNATDLFCGFMLLFVMDLV